MSKRLEVEPAAGLWKVSAGPDAPALAWFRHESHAADWAELHQPKSEVEVQPSRVTQTGLAAVQIAEQDAVLILGSFRLWFGPERRQELAELCAEKMREWESEG